MVLKKPKESVGKKLLYFISYNGAAFSRFNGFKAIVKRSPTGLLERMKAAPLKESPKGFLLTGFGFKKAG